MAVSSTHGGGQVELPELSETPDSGRKSVYFQKILDYNNFRIFEVILHYFTMYVITQNWQEKRVGRQAEK